MTRFFYERDLVMRQLAQRELIAARADEIARTFTPQRAGKLIANIQRNPTLPADVHLAAVDAPDPVRDRLEGSLASVFSGATMVGQAQTQNRSTRDVLERATSSPTGMVGDALNAARTVAKPVVRSVMPTLDFAPQAAQAASRTLYSGLQDPRQSLERYAEGGPQQGFRNLFADVAEQTDLGQQVVSAAQGDNPFDMGTGWFLSEQSDIFQRRQQAERSPGGRYGTGFLPNGEVYTAGRGLASMVGHVTGWDTFTADSEGQHAGYKILSGLTDATTAVAIPGFDRGLDNITDAGRAAYRAAGGAVDTERFLRDVGGMRGAATQIDLGQARQFLQSSSGRAMVDWLTSTNSVEEIWRRTNGKLDPELMTRLADETNPQRVMDAIWDGLQRGDVVEMSTRASAWRRGLTQNLRWTGEVPAARLDLNDGQSAVRWADDFATHTLVGSETRARWIDTMARATDIGARRSAYHTMLGDVAANLMSSGHTEETARMLTRYADDLTETFRIQVDEMASSGMMDWGRLRMLDPSGVMVDDRLPGAFMLSERATSLPVPDLRELKRGTGAFDSYFFTLDDSSAMNRLTNVFNKPQGDVARVLFDVLGGFQRFWKDAALMRLAYPIRVVAEEQIRMASAGYSSMFRHPLSYFSHMLTSNTRSMNGQLLSLDEVYQEALSGRSLSGMRDAGGGGIEHMVRLQRGASDPAEFARAWADEIETLRVDPVASRVARSTTINEAATWLQGEGGQYLDELRNMHPNSTWDANFVQEYVTSLSRRLHETTNGNPDLLAYIQGNGDALDVSRFIDDAPTHVTTTQLAPTGQGGTMARMGDLYDRSTGRIFEVLGAAPTNRFSRSPVFLQAYTDKLIELAPLSNSRNFDRAAELTGLFPGRRGRDVLAQLRSVSGNGRLTIGQIDELARRAALDEVQGLLYDLSRKGQFFDTYRLIFPFGEAWKEVVSTWSRLVKEDPFLLGRRAGQGSQAAGESIAHDGDSGDQGWFFVNENDETVFVYPGSEQLTGLLTGVPVEMTAGVSSLNMVGEVMPGVGPVAQYPASMFIPDDPRYDGIRNAIMPFGEPGDFRSVTTHMPAWLRRVMTTDGGMTPEEIRLFGNTKWRVAQYLYSTGDYDLSTPAGQAALLDDASSSTTRLWMVRGAVQFGAPAAPKMNPQVIGENGELVDFYVMYDRYRALVEADSETALEVFLNEFGADALLVPQGNTVSVAVGGVPLNGTAALDWVRENPEIRDAHPQLYGFFAPSDGSTEFNHDAYQRALDNGEIIPLTDEQKIRLANNRYGADQYNRARTALVTAMAANGQTSPTQEQTRIMSDLRARLERDYNGYNRVDDIGGRPDATTLIDQGDIERALADPLLRDTEVGQALSEYWEAHETVRQAAAILEIGNTADSWRTANDGAHLRSALRAIGEDLSARYPAFAPMWDDFLVDEFLDIADEKPQEGD